MIRTDVALVRVVGDAGVDVWSPSAAARYPGEATSEQAVQSSETTDLAALLGSSLSFIGTRLDAQEGLAVLAGGDDSSMIAWMVEQGRATECKDTRPAIVRSLTEALQASRIGAEIRVDTAGPTSAERDGAWNEELRAHFRSKGITTILTVPILLDGRTVGVFAFGMESSSRLCAEDHELLQTLAHHVSLALRLSNAAESARAAEPARQEAQAARVRADCIVQWRRRVDRAFGCVAGSAGVEAALGELLAGAVQQLGALGGSIWRAYATGVGGLVLTFEDGGVRDATASEHPGFRPLERRPQITLPLRRGEVRLDDHRTIQNHPDYAPFRDFLARQGVHSAAVVPMYLGEALQGALSLRFAEERRLNTDEIELLETFANQTVFAAEFCRLSRAARMAAVSEERNRLARDVHDTIAQGLAAIIRQLESVGAGPADESARRQIVVAIEVARESLAEARRAIRGLRPDLGDGRRLDAAVDKVVQRSRTLTSADIHLKIHGRYTSLPVEVESELLLIVQEALTNAVKHSAAANVAVDLWIWDGAVRVSVRDDGVGFDPARVVSGVGLSSMYERAQRIGATVWVTSVVGHGTEIVASWAASRLSHCWTDEA